MVLNLGMVQVVTAAPPVSPTVRPSHVLAEGAPAAPLGDHPELLPVHLHELDWDGPFVATHDAAGRPVHSRKPSNPMPAENRVHGRRRQADVRGETGRTPLVLPPQLHDPTLEPLIGAV